MLCAPFAIACLVAFTPPKEFDYEPKETYQIATLPTDLVSRACNKPAMACTFPKKHLIIISEQFTSSQRSAILRHEKAHLNGWIH